MDKFLSKYPISSGSYPATIDGYRHVGDLIRAFGGAVFGHGLLRVYSGSQSESVERIVAENYPEWDNKAIAFAGDWMGRQWLVDRIELDDSGNNPIVWMFDPEEGRVYDVLTPLSELFEMLAGDDLDELFEVDLYREWRASDGGEISWSECIGLNFPLALGGNLEISNLGRIDLKVYWSLTTQIIAGLSDVPLGSSVPPIAVDGE